MSRARVLLTGFAPFGGEPLNPSWELVRELIAEPLALPGLELLGARLPVSRDELPAALDALLEQHGADAVIAVGQATGRAAVSLERLAVNRLAYGEAVDNAGLAGVDEPLEPDGPAAREATLPVAELAQCLAREGHPVALSEDAGTFLCNALLFRVLATRPGLPALFVHVPLLPEQAQRRGRGEPSLTHELSREALLALLRRLPPLLGGPAPGGA